MREVAIVGVGMTRFGELWRSSLRRLFADAALEALADAGVDRLDSMWVGNMSAGRFVDQEHLGPLLAGEIGMSGVPATRVESACASGGAALRAAFFEVASGAADVVLAAGVEKMTDGAVTDSYAADRASVIDVLNQVLATEIVCTLRYKNHYFMAQGIHAAGVADEFLEHAQQEQAHADLVAKRITQLGGVPDFNPDGLVTRSHADYREGATLRAEDLVNAWAYVRAYRDEIDRQIEDQETA